MGLIYDGMFKSGMLIAPLWKSLAENFNSGSTLLCLWKYKHTYRYRYYYSTNCGFMGRADQVESEEGHLFGFCHTHSVR